jgi:hypothetical protein
MNKLKLAVGIILVFLVGALVGALGTGIYFKHFMQRFDTGGPPMSERVQIMSKRFARDLDLTDSQREEIERIVRESQEKILALGREIFPEIEKIDEESFALMRDVLDSEQKEKLDLFYQRVKGFRSRSKDKSGPPERNHDADPSQRSYEGYINEMRYRLDLSREQELKVREIMRAMAEEQRKVMEKYDADQVSPDPLSQRQEIFKIYENVEKELSDILNQEQMEKYRTFQKDRRK